MILGKIIGKTLTTNFKFLVSGDAKKFDYVQVMHKDVGYVLAQITEIEKNGKETIAYCDIIGYREKDGSLKNLRTPLDPECEVLRASDDFIKKTLGFEEGKNKIYIGTLEGRKNLKVYLDLNKLLTKHISVLAKSGSGKSYFCSVLVEELLEKNVPVLIIDPHGEYNTLKYPNENTKNLLKYNLKPKGFADKIQEYSPDTNVNPNAKQLKLNGNNLTVRELIHLLPAKLSNAQIGTLYTSAKNLEKIDFEELIFEIECSESQCKWSLINILEHLKKLNLFSSNFTLPNELIQTGKATIINLRGIPQEIQEIIVYKILNDLFNFRKLNEIPPFFLVIEEAHLFIPERIFGERKSSPIIRQIFTEGRKFGVGACIVSQRPSMIEKNALSQITTQVILRVTNPNDIKAIVNSVEGITAETEKEIKNIPVGTAMITGVVDIPLFVNIRPRVTKEGFSLNILEESKKRKENEKLIPVIKPKITPHDIKIMSDGLVLVKTILIPSLLVTCIDKEEEFNLLIDLNKGMVVKNIENFDGMPIIDLTSLSKQQSRVLKIALELKEFKPSELFAKSGVQFCELYDIVNTLLQKGYFEKCGDKYKINKNLANFSDLKKFAFYGNIEHLSLEYDGMLEKNVEFEKIKETLSKLLTIKNVKECWIIKYVSEKLR